MRVTTAWSGLDVARSQLCRVLSLVSAARWRCRKWLSAPMMLTHLEEASVLSTLCQVGYLAIMDSLSWHSKASKPNTSICKRSSIVKSLWVRWSRTSWKVSASLSCRLNYGSSSTTSTLHHHQAQMVRILPHINWALSLRTPTTYKTLIKCRCYQCHLS